jgi:YfiH family protein
MIVIKPFIFNSYPEIIFGFSTKKDQNTSAPYYFNLSYSVGDDKNFVDNNRQKFFSEIGLNEKMVGYQKQVHGDEIKVIESYGNCGESDALITTQKNLGLAISSADCPAIFIYDPINKIIAAVHSGWRGTEKKILKKTIRKLEAEFASIPSDLVCYIGPSISQQNYEVGEEVASKFNDKFILKENKKFYLDLAGANFQMLIASGVKQNNIQVSHLCTYEYKDLLHSYRRDGLKSGRALGIIAMKEK